MRELAENWRSELLYSVAGVPPYKQKSWSPARLILKHGRVSEISTSTLEQAAVESGYSYSALQKMVADGELMNVGKKGAPRIRRGDLPKKAARPRRPVASPTSPSPPALAGRLRHVTCTG